MVDGEAAMLTGKAVMLTDEMATLTDEADMLTVRAAMAMSRATTEVWPAPPSQPEERDHHHSWASHGPLPEPCQQAAGSPSARAQQREGAEPQPRLQSCVVLHPAHRCAYLCRDIFVFLSRKTLPVAEGRHVYQDVYLEA